MTRSRRDAVVVAFESAVGTADINLDECMRMLREHRQCLVEDGIDADDVEALGEWYTDALEARRTLRTAKTALDVVSRLTDEAIASRMDELDKLYEHVGGEVCLIRLVEEMMS